MPHLQHEKLHKIVDRKVLSVHAVFAYYEGQVKSIKNWSLPDIVIVREDVFVLPFLLFASRDLVHYNRLEEVIHSPSASNLRSLCAFAPSLIEMLQSQKYPGGPETVMRLKAVVLLGVAFVGRNHVLSN